LSLTKLKVLYRIVRRIVDGRMRQRLTTETWSGITKAINDSALCANGNNFDYLFRIETGAMFDRGSAEATYVRAQGFIREHLRDPDLCIDRISAALGCSKRYLHMLFSDRGMTVSDYIWKARLQHCRQELETQNGKTITDVAFSWGFSSSSHFSRVFRKYFGIAPSSVNKGLHGGMPVDVVLE